MIPQLAFKEINKYTSPKNVLTYFTRDCVISSTDSASRKMCDILVPLDWFSCFKHHSIALELIWAWNNILLFWNYTQVKLVQKFTFRWVDLEYKYVSYNHTGNITFSIHQKLIEGYFKYQVVSSSCMWRCRNGYGSMSKNIQSSAQHLISQLHWIWGPVSLGGETAPPPTYHPPILHTLPPIVT